MQIHPAQTEEALQRRDEAVIAERLRHELASDIGGARPTIWCTREDCLADIKRIQSTIDACWHPTSNLAGEPRTLTGVHMTLIFSGE
jgi:hypothetical protein